MLCVCENEKLDLRYVHNLMMAKTIQVLVNFSFVFRSHVKNDNERSRTESSFVNTCHISFCWVSCVWYNVVNALQT